jgi:hypothetical protein
MEEIEMTHTNYPNEKIDLALEDIKRLLAVLNFLVNEKLEDDSDEQREIFVLIDAIGDKVEAVGKMVDGGP